MPTVKELDAFVAVTETGSFEAAARRLNTTAPAMSKRVSELEAELGVRLFERTTRRCQITLRGRLLVPFAQRVLGDISDIKRSIGERSSLTGHLRLGVAETIAYTRLPVVLQKLSTDLPRMTIEVEIGPSSDLIPEVRTRELDIACVVGPVTVSDLVSEPFWEAPLSWFAAGPKWAGEPLTIEELAQQTILLAAKARHSSVVEGWFKSRGVRPKQIIICNSMSTAVKMTAIGMGMTMAPIDVARQELDAGTVTAVPVQVQLPTNACVTIYPIGQVEPALTAAIDVMRKLAATLVMPDPVKPSPRRTGPRRGRW
jgi:DNA-binding transcriptional LysR family regulator